jgi:hypothetical protein
VNIGTGNLSVNTTSMQPFLSDPTANVPSLESNFLEGYSSDYS